MSEDNLCDHCAKADKSCPIWRPYVPIAKCIEFIRAIEVDEIKSMKEEETRQEDS